MKKSYELRGSDLGKLYHAGKKKIRRIDPKKLGERDPGWYGAGFYVAEDPDYVREWYGPVVTEFTVAPTARVLKACVRPADARPGLFDAVMKNERRLLARRGNLNRSKEVATSLRQNHVEWVHAVDRFAESAGYDVVWFSAEEIVVKSHTMMRPTMSKQRSAKQESAFDALIAESVRGSLFDELIVSENSEPAVDDDENRYARALVLSEHLINIKRRVLGQ